MSSSAAILVATVGTRSATLTVVLCVIWGMTTIADSAQFSALVTELAEPADVGTALTIQNCLGFLLTMVSIQLTGPMQMLGGWPLAFSILAVGPLLGSVAMWRLRGTENVH